MFDLNSESKRPNCGSHEKESTDYIMLGAIYYGTFSKCRTRKRLQQCS